MPTSATDRTDGENGRSDGFTLFELLAVLTIMALSIGVLMHMLPSGSGNGALRSSASALANEFRNARILAINRQRQSVVRIDAERRLVRASGQPKPLQLARSIRLQITSADSEQTERGLAGVRFFPNGSSTGGTVVLKQNGNAYEVRVNWLTGRVSVGSAG